MKGGKKEILPFSKGESEGICSIFFAQLKCHYTFKNLFVNE